MPQTGSVAMGEGATGGRGSRPLPAGLERGLAGLRAEVHVLAVVGPSGGGALAVDHHSTDRVLHLHGRLPRPTPGGDLTGRGRRLRRASSQDLSSPGLGPARGRLAYPRTGRGPAEATPRL